MKFNVFRIFSKILWSIFIVGVVVLAIVLILVGLNLKHVAAIYSEVNTGKNNLEQALNKATAKDFVGANESAKTASEQITLASNEVSAIRLGPIVYIPLVKSYKDDAEHLVLAGISLAQAMTEATNYATGLGSIISANSQKTFTQLSGDERRNILAVIYEAPTTLTDLKTNLDDSLSNLQAIKSLAWFGPLSTRLEQLKDKISSGQRTIEQASPLTQLLPPLLGYPNEAKYLLILQNSDELRPTGGFIGTFGIIQTKDGDFLKFETHDIYHLDMPVKDKVSVTPPDPLKKYLGVDKWYMRDANWSPDWPTSAEKVLWFYKTENSVMPTPFSVSDFDGVIGITPELITDLMGLTGPIVIDKQTYTPQNFIDILQYKIEKGFVQEGTPSWQKKEVIGEIAKIMKQKLFDLPLGQWPTLIKLVSDNVNRKNILLYSKNTDLEKLILDQGWGGEVRHDWGDYLMVVDANMAALKTDAVIDRQIDYQLKEDNGVLKATLNLRYSHSGHYDWRTSDYRTYTRVYVPAGSHLIKATGFTEDQVTTGEEDGKTYFGAFLSVKPGQIGQLSFEYELPDSIIKNMHTYNNYRLTIQKQPGKEVNKLDVDLSFKNAIKSYSPASFYSGSPDKKSLDSQGDLKIDRSFLVNF